MSGLNQQFAKLPYLETGTEGSNPSLSAKSNLQLSSAAVFLFRFVISLSPINNLYYFYVLNNSLQKMKNSPFLFLLIFQISLKSFAQQDFEKGKRFFEKSEFDSAKIIFSDKIASCNGKCSDTTLALYKTWLGKTFNVLEQYESALIELEQSISLMHSAKNYNGEAFAMISLAEMYRRSYKLEKAKNQIKEVFEIHKTQPLEKNNEAYMYNRYAAIISEMKDSPENVFFFSQKAIEISSQTGNLDLMASSLTELGFYEEHQKKSAAAARHFLQAYKIYKEQKNRIYIAQILTNLARVSLQLGKNDESEKYLKEGIELTENTTWHDTRAGLLRPYSMFLYKQGRYKESWEVLEKFVDVYETQLRKQHSKELLEMETKYDLGKKATLLELEKQKSELAKSETGKRTEQRNYIAGGVVLLFILLLLLFYFFMKIKKANSLLASALLERNALLKEVNHRVKNNLQVISSLLDLQAEHTQEENTRLQLLEGKNRINSIAQVHEMMYAQDSLEHLNMKEYFTLLGDEIKNNLWKETNTNLEINCDNISLKIGEAIPVGILLNELLTNSFKHANPIGNALEILVELVKNKNEIKMHYKDNGQGKIPSTVEKKGMGSTIISSMVRQLHGKSEISFNKNFQFNLVFEIRENGKNSNR